MKTASNKLTLVTLDDQDLPIEELGDFLFMIRGAYSAAHEFCVARGLLEAGCFNITALVPEFEAHVRQLRLHSIDEHFQRNLGPEALKAMSITRSSPWEIIFYGVLPVLTMAVVISGGEISVCGIKCRIGSLGDGIRKLRSAFGLKGNVMTGYGVRSVKIKLNKTEYAELMKQDPSQKNKGGFQHFLVSIQNRISKSTRELELSEDDLDRILRFKSNPKKGGWQARFNKIFARHFP